MTEQRVRLQVSAASRRYRRVIVRHPAGAGL